VAAPALPLATHSRRFVISGAITAIGMGGGDPGVGPRAVRFIFYIVTVQVSRRAETARNGEFAPFPAAARSAMIGGEPQKMRFFGARGDGTSPLNVYFIFLGIAIAGEL
jgi:hypothetical protein